jgi:thiol-disulfide isomerase/thioredoxin
MAVKNIVELNDGQWEDVVGRGGRPVAVMFYNPTCPHCIAMMPYFEKYADEFKDRATFARIDVGKNPIAVAKYGIMGTPTFEFFCGGRPIQEIVGVAYPTLLKKFTEEALDRGKDCSSRSTLIDYDVGYA